MSRRFTSLVIATVLAVLIFHVSLRFSASVASQGGAGSVIISEVAWAGTVHSPSDEWIELYNRGDVAINLSSWTLSDSSGDISITLEGSLEPGAFYLLERTDDETVSDVLADTIYTGNLNNGGETITLFDNAGLIIDTANAAGGSWPAGAASPAYASMERVAPDASDGEDDWQSNDQVTTNGTDAGGNAVNGTPRAANSSWVISTPELPDLAVSLTAPDTVVAAELIRYDVQVANDGHSAALGVMVTATLPAGIDYLADDSGLSPDLTMPGNVIWAAGDIEIDDVLSFALTATVAATVEEVVITQLVASSDGEEIQLANNHTQAETVILSSAFPAVLISAVLYDGYELGDADEAVQLINSEPMPVAIEGWHLSDGNTLREIGGSITVGPGESIWLTGDGAAFERQFGLAPDVVLEQWPGFANNGDEVMLYDMQGNLVDALVYKSGDASTSGWSGPPLLPYQVSNLFAEEGQLLFRRKEETTGLPVADSNTVSDWAQMTEDPVQGRKVQYPGWSMDRFFQPVIVGETEGITVAVAPDNAFQAVVRQIESAQQTIQISSLTFENVAIGQVLLNALERDVAVSVLLEGTPVGGIEDQQRYICQQLEQSGGQCWYMIRDDGSDVHDRYRYMHAKYMIIDGERALIATENLSPFSLPNDDKADGTWGRRGVILITTAEGIVGRITQLFADDLAPLSHQDILRWHADDAVYGAPPDGFVPVTVTGGISYPVRYPLPVHFSDVSAISIFNGPENLLRSSDGLLALLNEAGEGDTVLVQQLTERWHWGSATSEPESDPNPRLEAYVDAARRGATVRILLDSFFDESGGPLSNKATCDYIQQIAISEHLRLRCALANPTGLGIHNKMVLLQVGGLGWLHVGSWNGTEQSTKGNREVALQIRSDAAYAYLASLFESDWPHVNWLPMLATGFQGPGNYPLITEFLYDPAGSDEGEFIEITNPTFEPLDLSGWMISDAVSKADFEDTRRFPPGTVLAPRAALVVALSAIRFETDFGIFPDFEILDSSAAVPDLLDDLEWGDPAALLQLGNNGDEILLRSPDGNIVDAVTYGTGSYPGVVSCALVKAPGYSLERLPYWRDSGNCSDDFRPWPFPSPGQLP